MDHTGRSAHWEAVYRNRPPTERSWFEPIPGTSLEFIDRAGLQPGARVVDVGGGTARMSEALLERGLRPTVLDISEAALDEARQRLGDRADQVRWVTADVTEMPAIGPFELWHDRAVFHFLTDVAERERYVDLVRRALVPGGQVVLATFAEDGPQRCSGLPTMRYDAAGIARALGIEFELLESQPVEHPTPAGAVQRFRYTRFRRRLE